MLYNSMDALKNEFENIFTITHNPLDIIPYKYFTNSFNGSSIAHIEALLMSLGLTKKLVQYNNIENYYINKVKEGNYLININNTYRNTFIETYTDKDKFKIYGLTGIKENTILKNNTKTNHKLEPIPFKNDIKEPYNKIELLLNSIQSLKNNLVQTMEQIETIEHQIVSLISIQEDTTSIAEETVVPNNDNTENIDETPKDESIENTNVILIENNTPIEKSFKRTQKIIKF